MRAVAKVKISRAGGAKHLLYICRGDALQATRSEQEREGENERENIRSTNDHEIEIPNLRGKSKAKARAKDPGRDDSRQPEKAATKDQAQGRGEESSHQAEAVWTWNAPAYVTGDNYGTRAGSQSLERGGENQAVKNAGQEGVRSPEGSPLRLNEKVENACAYFGLLSDLEKKKGLVNSYRMILTVNGQAGEHGIKEAVNSFLKENFPSAQALVALHRNTAHVHAHVYIHSRQLNGKKIDLKQEYFQLDESWSRVCSEQFHDPLIYEEHMRLKAETTQYRHEEKRARAKGEQGPAKPGRWADGYDIRKGIQRPWEDRWVGRLMASSRVAETKADYLKAIKAPEMEQREAAREAQELSLKLECVTEKRALSRSEAKRNLPGEIITLKEQKELGFYTRAIREAKLPDMSLAAEEVRPLEQTTLPFMSQPAGQLAFEFNHETKGGRAKGIKGKQIATQSRERQKSHGQRPDKNRERRALGTSQIAEFKPVQESPQITPWKTHEEKIQSAQSFVLKALRQYGQDETLLVQPEQYIVALSDKVRSDLTQKFNLSVQTLGYTKEAWASIVHINAASALRPLSKLNEHAHQCQEQLTRAKVALDGGDRKLLSLLSGENPLRGCETGLKEQSVSNIRGYEQGSGKNEFVKAHEREAVRQHEHLDREEHIFIR